MEGACWSYKNKQNQGEKREVVARGLSCYFFLTLAALFFFFLFFFCLEPRPRASLSFFSVSVTMSLSLTVVIEDDVFALEVREEAKKSQRRIRASSAKKNASPSMTNDTR